MIMRQILRPATTAILALAALPGTALAHPGHEFAGNLMAGLVHPLGGLDHVLMIVAVSAWAAMLSPVGRIAVAAALAMFVGIGALLPVSGGVALEDAISLTVIGAGILLAVGRRWPTWATASLAACFALVHGFAHGAEGPVHSGSYVAGLVLATAAMALATSFLAALIRDRASWLRAGGIAAALGGISALIT